MNADVKSTLDRVATWPSEDQEELAQIALEIEARRHGVYDATPEELAAIDEALAAVARGEIATDEEVEAVRYSKLALAELYAILDYIASANPDAAVRVEARFQRVIERIARFPASAPEISLRPGIRSVPLVRYPYTVHYTVKATEVVILRITHGARRSPWS